MLLVLFVERISFGGLKIERTFAETLVAGISKPVKTCHTQPKSEIPTPELGVI